MAQFKRKKLFVDSEVQRLLVWRIIIYWLACMATLELVRLTWVISSEPEQPGFFAYFVNYDWRSVGVRMSIAAVLLVPIVWDVLSFSNRFAGPVYRMRRILREVAQNGTVEHVQLRRGDYWQGMADDLNAALQRLAPSQKGASASSDGDEQSAVAADAEWLTDDIPAAR